MGRYPCDPLKCLDQSPYWSPYNSTLWPSYSWPYYWSDIPFSPVQFTNLLPKPLSSLSVKKCHSSQSSIPHKPQTFLFSFHALPTPVVVMYLATWLFPDLDVMATNLLAKMANLATTYDKHPKQMRTHLTSHDEDDPHVSTTTLWQRQTATMPRLWATFADKGSHSWLQVLFHSYLIFVHSSVQLRRK